MLDAGASLPAPAQQASKKNATQPVLDGHYCALTVNCGQRVGVIKLQRKDRTPLHGIAARIELLELQELARKLETTGRRLVEAPTDLGFRRYLLHQAEQMSTFAHAEDLPLFLRSAAKEAEAMAIRLARAVESPAAADLDEIVRELSACLEELHMAIERGRA